MFNGCAWRLLKVATALGRDPYLVGARFQVGPRNLPAANSGYALDTSSAVYPFLGVALAEWVLMNG